MRLMTRFLMAMAVVTLFTVTALPVLAQDGYKLRRVFKVNDIRRYKVVMDMNGEMLMGENSMPLNMQMVITYREKVAGIKEGKATVHTTFESMKMYMNGQEFASPMAPDMSNTVVTTVLDDRNKVYEIKGLDKVSVGAPGVGNLNFGTGLNAPAMFPEGEVKVGDSWETDVPIPNAGDLKISAKQTFVSVEKVAGVEAARIKTEMEVPIEKLMASMAEGAAAGMPPMTGTMKVVSYTFFDLANGNILKADGDMVMTMQMQGGNPQMPQNMQMNMTAKISLTQIKDEKPAGK